MALRDGMALGTLTEAQFRYGLIDRVAAEELKVGALYAARVLLPFRFDEPSDVIASGHLVRVEKIRLRGTASYLEPTVKLVPISGESAVCGTAEKRSIHPSGLHRRVGIKGALEQKSPVQPSALYGLPTGYLVRVFEGMDDELSKLLTTQQSRAQEQTDQDNKRSGTLFDLGRS